MGVAAAKVILLDATVKAVHSKPDAIFKLKDEQRTALKTFLSGKDVLASLPMVCKRHLHQYLQDALEQNVAHLWFSEEELLWFY